MTITDDTTTTVGLPPGWKMNTSKTAADRSCVAVKHLEDFKYAEVRYEPEDGVFGNDYAVYKVNCEGPGAYQAELFGRFENLHGAIKAGERL
jgi:hypothetical protein